MNTSHNKNRIIEHGWKNIFKNIVGCRKSQIFPDNSTYTEMSDPYQSDSVEKSNRKNRMGIFMITSSKQNTKSTKANSGPLSLTPIPSTSNGQFGSGPSKRKSSDSSISSAGSVSTLDPRTLQKQKEKRQDKMQNLVSEMIKVLESENQYIMIFRHLIAIKDGSKDFDYHCYEHLKGNDALPRYIETIKYTKSKSELKKMRRKSARKGTSSNFNVTNAPFSQTISSYVTHNTNFVGDKSERTKLRKKILHDLYSSDTANICFDNLIDQLVSLEESFIE